MNGEHKRSSADVMVTQTTLIKRLFILSVTGLMLMCGGCFSGMSVYAQNATSSNAQHAKKISGVVIDSNGEPIIGAAVLVQGTSVGVATDVDGKFSLDVPSNGKTLVVSYIGYDNQEVPCTTILVGKAASYDGSTMIARNDDSGSGHFTAKKFTTSHGMPSSPS